MAHRCCCIGQSVRTGNNDTNEDDAMVNHCNTEGSLKETLNPSRSTTRIAPKYQADFSLEARIRE